MPQRPPLGRHESEGNPRKTAAASDLPSVLPILHAALACHFGVFAVTWLDLSNHSILLKIRRILVR